MKDMCEESLRRLQTDYIDIYWIHNSSDVERWTPRLIPLVRSGRVKRVGVSNHNLAQIKRVEEILAAANISPYIPFLMWEIDASLHAISAANSGFPGSI